MKRLAALTLGLALSACGGSTPEDLAAQMEKALQNGDVDAVLALGDLQGAPPEALFFYIDMVPECLSGSTCKVALAPYTAEAMQEDSARAQEQGIEMSRPPLGMLVVSSQSTDPKVEGGTKLQLPYAAVDGVHKVIIGRYTKAKLDELRATSTDALVDKMLAGGIYDDATRAHRTDWKQIATTLAAGGGEVGAWFKQRTEAVHLAAQAADLEAVIKAGGRWEAMLYRDKDFDGKPIPRKVLLLKLRSQSIRALATVNVLGGYQYGTDTLLAIEGTTSTGWIVRGPILISESDGDLAVSGRGTISYPAP